MKTLTVIISFLLITVSCHAQSPNRDHFYGTLMINGQITYGDTTQDIINAFGQPDDIKSEYWEMDETTATIYIYQNGSEFAFVNNKLDSFILSSSNYYIQMDSFQLKTGNNINTIQSKFPKSYANRASGGTTINLGTGDYTFLLIEYNSNNIITKIEQRIF